jgi:hypothetical protein
MNYTSSSTGEVLMNIVIEGPDNSGKSTLAELLSERTRMPIVPSEGPSKYPGEINERIKRYLAYQGVIFDRHPAVSDPIYNSFRRTNITPIDQDLVQAFYSTKPYFIYCRGKGNLDGHNVKPHDTEEHLAMLQLHQSQLCRLYDTWAHDHAHITYRMGDSQSFAIIMRALSPVFDPVSDIEHFHKKFMLQYSGRPRMLPAELLKFRYNFMEEELEEYKYWTRARGKDEPVQLEGALDSLVDLVYVALGTSYMAAGA